MNSELSSSPNLNSEFDERKELELILQEELHDIEEIIQEEKQSDQSSSRPPEVQLNLCPLLTELPSVRVFVEQANGLPRLNFSGQRKAKERVDYGDREALQELVITGIPWVFRIAHNYCCERQSVDEFLDFFQEGIFGLVKAVRRWNPEEGPLQSYAGIWIMQRIQRYEAIQGSTLRLPVHIQEKRAKILKEILKTGNLPFDICDVELAQWLPPLSLNSDLSWVLQTWIEDQILSPKEEPLCCSNCDRTRSPASIISPREEPLPDGEYIFEAIIDPCSLEECVIEKLYREEVRAWLNKSNLSERERFVIFQRYGFNDEEEEEKTLEEVGKLLGITRERVRQIEAKAIRKLRHPSHSALIKVSDRSQRQTHKKHKQSVPFHRQNMHAVESEGIMKEVIDSSPPVIDRKKESLREFDLIMLALEALLGDFKPSLKNITWYIKRLNDSEIEHFWRSFFEVEAVQQLLTNKQREVIRKAIKRKELNRRLIDFMRRALVRLYNKIFTMKCAVWND